VPIKEGVAALVPLMENVAALVRAYKGGRGGVGAYKGWRGNGKRAGVRNQAKPPPPAISSLVLYVTGI
jgi:hypothetical protein